MAKGTKTKAAPIDDRSDTVFLTPRVLDQGAFDAMSGELKELIRDADGHGKTLKKSGDDVRSLAGALRNAIAELQARIDRAGAVSPALEGWVKQAQEITARVIDKARIARDVERTVTAIVDGRKAEFEHAVAPTVETLKVLRREFDRVKSAVDAATDEGTVRSRAERATGEVVRAAVDDLAGRIGEMVRGAFDNQRIETETALEARIVWAASVAAGIQTAAEEACVRIAVEAAKAEQCRIDAANAIGALNERMAALEQASAERFATAEDRMMEHDRRWQTTQTRINSMTAQVEEARRRAEDTKSGVERQLADATEQARVLAGTTVSEIESRLGHLENTAARLSSLPGSMARAEWLLAEIREAHTRNESLSSQLAMTRTLLGEEILTAAGKVDEIAVAAERVRTGVATLEIESATRGHETLVQSINATMENGTRIEELTRLRLAELREVESILANLDKRIATTRTRVQDMMGTEIKPFPPRDAA